MAIALKEANEASYWLRLLYATDYLTEAQFTSIHANCTELIKMLTTIVRKTLQSPDA
jgi:four helix bundle protein